MTNVRVKPINELEVKSEVSVNDKILILDSVSEEARLASKDELKGDKGDKWDTWSTWPQGVPWTPWTPWKDWEDWEDGKDWNWITSVTSTKVWKTTTVTMNFDEWDPFSFEVQDWEDGGGGGWSWDVVWPASSTDWHLAVFDWATWKIIKDWWAMPTIPTKVSDLTNDSGYITSSYHDATKQDLLTAWTNIQIQNNVISATWWSDIVYATQAEYNALLPWAASDWKHYFIYSISGGWDMNNRALAQTSSWLSGNWYGWVFFNSDGTKIYFTTFFNKIYESSLSTPYDLSLISQSKYLDTTSDNIYPEDIHLSTDGTKLYTIDWYNWTIYEYGLSTAWDVSTATLTWNSVWPFTAFIRWLYITPDGKEIFITQHNSTTYYHITMSTAWDLSTAWTSVTWTSSIWWLSIWIWNWGSFIAGQWSENTSNLDYGTLSTPYNLSTATDTWTKNIWVTRAGWIWFNNSWTMCVMIWWWSGTNYITKYTL